MSRKNWFKYVESAWNTSDRKYKYLYMDCASGKQAKQEGHWNGVTIHSDEADGSSSLRPKGLHGKAWFATMQERNLDHPEFQYKLKMMGMEDEPVYCLGIICIKQFIHYPQCNDALD
ncbi:hypothetical protein IV203_033188 [Nitzschia inconspicua]|uniref:Uncharacterized protein n=1 Tax=Nitzschia inconspicua TaxID=303405 RepID=A0A9K3PFI1_9STRA|nr:hypothetical protein IV203_033188 [Nitzschia inconspicua]